RLYFNLAKSGGFIPAQMSTAGGQVNPVSVPFERAYITDVSPDGSSLLVHPYAIDVEDYEATYVLPLSGGTPRRLGGGAFLEARWSPDGRWIVYNEDADLYVAKSDGSEPRKLPTPQGYPVHTR